MDTIKIDKVREPIEGKTVEEILVHGTAEELDTLKSWLFTEDIRIESERNELNRIQQKFVAERKQFQDEMKELHQKMVIEKKRLKEDTAFFEKKMEILKSGFSQLDMDKRKFEKERIQFLNEKEAASKDITYGRHMDTVELLFRGVNNPLSLKKRYKDLIKMFHPDNIAGDHEMILVINRVYEELKSEYEYGRQA